MRFDLFYFVVRDPIDNVGSVLTVEKIGQRIDNCSTFHTAILSYLFFSYLFFSYLGFSYLGFLTWVSRVFKQLIFSTLFWTLLFCFSYLIFCSVTLSISFGLCAIEISMCRH